MLKRILFTATFCLSLVSINAISIDEAIARFSKAKNAEVENIKTGSPAGNKSNGVDSLTVINLEKCDDSIKKQFTDIIAKNTDPAYDTLVKTSEGNEKTLILTQSNEKGGFKSMVIFSIDEKDFVIVKMMGNISAANLPSILNN